MALFVHHEKKFNRQLNRLRRGGKAASLAAHRAEEIIKRLSSKGQIGYEDIHRRTKNGELRLNKSLKYDLGGGYRLICLKQGKHHVLLYIGTHDDCDRWLENNRRFQFVFNKESREVAFEKAFEKKNKLSEDELEQQVEYDDILMKKIDDKTLRSVFSGLCKEK